MIAYRAMELAKACHEGQKRKYTGNPYSDHLCSEVRQDARESITQAAKSGLTHAYYQPKPYYSLENKTIAIHHLITHLEAEGYEVEYRREQSILLIKWSGNIRPWYIQLWYDILKEFRV
jgi:hypothetical protein